MVSEWSEINPHFAARFPNSWAFRWINFYAFTQLPTDFPQTRYEHSTTLTLFTYETEFPNILPPVQILAPKHPGVVNFGHFASPRPKGIRNYRPISLKGSTNILCRMKYSNGHVTCQKSAWVRLFPPSTPWFSTTLIHNQQISYNSNVTNRFSSNYPKIFIRWGRVEQSPPGTPTPNRYGMVWNKTPSAARFPRYWVF